MFRRRPVFPAVCVTIWTSFVATPLAQPPVLPPTPIEKLSPTRYRVGTLTVDTSTKEVAVPATVNDVEVIEFAANARNGIKAYESLLTLDTDAVSFNAALLLIGLDPARGRPAKRQFDDGKVSGDPVELTVAWKGQKLPIDHLLFDRRTSKTVAGGPWVYTGSTFVDMGPDQGRRFMAEIDGILIGLMRGPSALIENPRTDTVNGFGSIVLNPNIGLKPGTAVTLTVKALPRAGQKNK